MSRHVAVDLQPAAAPDIHRAQGDSGAVALLVALMIPMLLIFVAVAVDISRWYVELQRMQRAADAAALAAAPYMPESLAAGGPASKAALTAVERNGFTDAQATVDKVTGSATRVSVTVTAPVDNFFATVIGIPTTTLTRTGIADFAGPVAMGSPCNLFGREDMESVAGVNKPTYGSPDCASAGSYWVNIAGTNTNKARGDGFSSSWCTQPDTSIGPDPKIDRCSGTSSSASNPGLNLDWNSTKPGIWPYPTPWPASSFAPEFPGYVFKVRAKAAGTLKLEGYDMGWVATGDNCDQGNLVGVSVTNGYVFSTTEAAKRYARNQSAFCTGDTQMTGYDGDSSKVETVVTVRRPSANPYAPLEGTVICTNRYDGYDLSTPLTALSLDNSLNNKLARSYHRWSNLLQSCTNPLVTAGEDYSIQVQTFGGGGQNRFALRAYLNANDGGNVSIFAVDRMSLFNNVTAGTSYFNLVRLDNSAKGHVLNVRFYDMGDSNQPVVATVLQPDDSPPTTDTAFDNCTGEGPVAGALTGCTVTATASVNGGRWQTIRIPITDAYTCSDDNNQAKCWVRIRLNTTAAQADTTTWAADLEGDPVRLVQ